MLVLSNSRVVHDVENLKVIEQEKVPDCANRTNSPTERHEIDMKVGMVVLGLATSHCPKKSAGTFTQQLGWVFVGPCHPSAHGPPAFMAHDKNETPKNMMKPTQEL